MNSKSKCNAETGREGVRHLHLQVRDVSLTRSGGTAGMMLKPLVLFSLSFGPWPTWTDLYLASCAANPEVRWVIPTDQPLPDNRPENVDFLPMTLDGLPSG